MTYSPSTVLKSFLLSRASRFALVAGAAALSIACGDGSTFSSTPTWVEHEPSTILSVDCSTADGADPQVPAGETVTCEILVDDPDPDSLSLDVALLSSNDPAGGYSLGGGLASGDNVWRFTFTTDAADAGYTFRFAVTASEGTHENARESFTVAVY